MGFPSQNKISRCKTHKVTILSGSKLSKFDGDPIPNANEYRSVVGALQYVTLSRPNIASAVNQVWKFMHDPRTLHWMAVKRILHFLKGTILLHGLHFCKGSFSFIAHSSVDWVGDLTD